MANKDPLLCLMKALQGFDTKVKKATAKVVVYNVKAKDRVMAKTKAKRKGPKPTVTIDKPDSLVSMKVMTPKESYDAMIESGIFSDIEIQNFIFDDFEEGYQRNPEKDPQNKPYKEKSRAERMADPDRGINSPAFKKFMASQGM